MFFKKIMYRSRKNEKTLTRNQHHSKFKVLYRLSSVSVLNLVVFWHVLFVLIYSSQKRGGIEVYFIFLLLTNSVLFFCIMYPGIIILNSKSKIRKSNDEYHVHFLATMRNASQTHDVEVYKTYLTCLIRLFSNLVILSM